MTSKKQEILDISEKLFRELGYSSVNLRLIASSAEIKKASLYYHFPGGKEEIFVQVNLRSFQHHYEKIKEIEQSHRYLDKRIDALVNWLISQPGLHLISMMHLDMENLEESNYRIIYEALFTKIFLPISNMFQEANDQGNISINSAQAVTGAFLAMMDSFEIIPHISLEIKEKRIKEVIGIFLNGMKRSV